jgi:DNA polymerase-4
MADAFGTRLRAHGKRARTVTLKVRFGDFTTVSRSHTVRRPTDSSTEISRVARELATTVDPTAGVRLLGVGVAGFVEETVDQLSLDDLLVAATTVGDRAGAQPASVESWRQAEHAVDDLRARFGREVIGPGSTLRDRQLRPKARGDQAWGPDQAEPGPT